MDKILIKDLEVYAYHGVNIEEKNLGQKYLISLELYMDLKEAGKKDDLNSTVNYGDLCIEVEKLFKSERYDLIEAAAESVANFILTKYDKVQRVKVKLKKPSAPIPCSLDYAAVEIDRTWHIAYIGLGSNLGDKKKNLKDAIEEIKESKFNKITKTSEIYETKPVGYTDQDNFLNCAIEIKTLLTPIELIQFLLEAEKKLKRERIVRWGPRTIDLDVLLYDNIITSVEEIVIPHPRMHERLFVLEPLSKIAPYIMHPIINKRIIELRDEIAEKEKLL